MSQALCVSSITGRVDALQRAKYDHCMSASQPTVSGIVLAGGQSRRMGRDKALIEFQGKPILACVIDTLHELTHDVVVVANRSDLYGSFGAQVVADYDPPCGPLGGIAAGLSAVQHDLAVVVACDMPFLNVALLRWLIDLTEDFDAVVPLSGTNYEPLHAVYRWACRNPIVQRIEKGDRRVVSFFADVQLRPVPEPDWRVLDPEGRSLWNLNTPDDVLFASRM